MPASVSTGPGLGLERSGRQMISGLLIAIREGMEAALIISIIFTFLVKLGRPDQFKRVWLGVGAAIGLSALFGIVILLTLGELSGSTQQIFEGSTTLLAVAVLTYMIFWMRKQSRHIKGEIESKISEALQAGTALALPVMAFIAVIREGLETVLMLSANSQTTSVAGTYGGAAIGFAISITLGYLIYKGGIRLNLKTFFTVTGAFLIIIASGLLAYSAKELSAAGVIPALSSQPVYDLSASLPDHIGQGVSAGSIGGSMLKGFVGYNDNPKLIEVLLYWTYLLVVGSFFLAPGARPQPKAAPSTDPTTS